MIRRRILNFIKGIFRDTDNESYILVTVTTSLFLIIFALNSIFGMYSVYRISYDIRANMQETDLARNSQIALQDQFLSWENILVSGKNDTAFRKNYHEFSLHSEEVQNRLFNLKLRLSDNSGLTGEIERLIENHRKITAEFTTHIVDMEINNFKNIRDKIELTRGKENDIIEDLSDVAERIVSDSESSSSRISGIHLISVFISSFIFIIILFRFGKKLIRRLVKTHIILEKMVTERTRDYVEANLSLQNEIEEHKSTAEKLMESRNETELKNMLLSVSEKKYRHIVEGTKEVIFTLDENWHFITANDAIRSEFKIMENAISSYSLIELIYDELTDAAMLRSIIAEKLDESRKSNTPFRFNAHIKTPNLIEPVEYKLSLEFIEYEGRKEVIGKASRIIDDRFTEYFISEKCEYRIRNLLFTADDISHRITDNLQKYIDKNEATTIRIGLREIIINSIEHGNLNISFEEKSEALMNDRYFEFINERQSHPDYRDRRVRIEYMISPLRAIYKVSDQGKGFNHKKFIAGFASDPEEIHLTHGRGIAMVRSIFDEVRYNSKGNQVLLVKNFCGTKEPEFNEQENVTAGYEYR